MKPIRTPARSIDPRGRQAAAARRGRPCWLRCRGSRTPSKSGAEVFTGRPRSSRLNCERRRVRCPPRSRRTSSSPPSSNSWLPSVPTSKSMRFIARTEGSSWKWLDSRGEAPTMSPACTRMVRPGVAALGAVEVGVEWPRRRRHRPAPAARHDLGGSRWPWKSFTPSSWISTEPAAGLPRLRRRRGPAAAASPSAATAMAPPNAAAPTFRASGLIARRATSEDEATSHETPACYGNPATG